jgi:hypothetical protein
VLSGQAALVAATMPPQPTYTAPPTETSGAYRLATLSPLTEEPCVLAFNQERIAHNLPPAVVDEWLVENTRAIAAVGMNSAAAGDTVNFITTGNAFVSGGATCANDLVKSSWANSDATMWLTNVDALWFGGLYIQGYGNGYNGHSGVGVASFPIDPRIYSDPNGLIWP